MSPSRFKEMMDKVTTHLRKRSIPYAVIGAFALGYYGLPRFTADIDLISEKKFQNRIAAVMAQLGYTCLYETEIFSQFDSDNKDLWDVDFLFVQTESGKLIIHNSVNVLSSSTGTQPVIQPTDYIILKIMAIANNPGRTHRDAADIISLLRLNDNHKILKPFDEIQKDRVFKFAEKFGQTRFIQDLFAKAGTEDSLNWTL